MNHEDTEGTKAQRDNHIANSLVWSALTGDMPPAVPPTENGYTRAGFPWFEYYGGDDSKPLSGAERLASLKNILAMAAEKDDVPLPENESATPALIIKLRLNLARNQVREGKF